MKKILFIYFCTLVFFQTLFAQNIVTETIDVAKINKGLIFTQPTNTTINFVLTAKDTFYLKNSETKEKVGTQVIVNNKESTYEVFVKDNSKGIITVKSKIDPPPNIDLRNPDLTKGIDYLFISNNFEDEIKKLPKNNAVILFDFGFRKAPSAQVFSNHHRLYKNKIKKGDFVKVYLINVNPYIFDYTINGTQTNYQYDTVFRLVQPPISKTEDKETKTQSSINEQDNNNIKLLLKFCAAVNELEIFIKHTKENRFPDADKLVKNKNIIIKKLDSLNIISFPNLEEVYNKLSDDKKTSYKEVYKKAIKFNEVLYEFKSLTYIISYYDNAPIQIGSYDNLNINIKKELKEKENKNAVTYNYNFRIIGGIKIDQSFGVVGHGIVDQKFSLSTFNGLDTTYTLKSNKGFIFDTTYSQIVKKRIDKVNNKDRDKVAFSLSTLTHLYLRTGFVNIGPSIGFATDFYPQAGRLRYLFGGSILLSDGTYRIVFNGGYCYGTYRGFGNNQDYGTILKGSDSQPTIIDINTWSPFLGLSCNVPISFNKTQK